MFKLVLEETEEPEIKLPTSAGSWKKQESSRKTSIFDYAKAFDCVDHNKLENCERDGNTRLPDQTTWPASWETCMQVKKQQLELSMQKKIGSKSAKEYIKAVSCHPTYLTYMQNTLCKMMGWMKHKLESRLLGEISITSDMKMIPPL